MLPAALGAISLLLLWAGVHQRRSRASANRDLAKLGVLLHSTRAQLRRLAEDVFVLRSVLGERHLVSDLELARSRVRLIESPRQRAAERDALTQHLGALPNQLVMEDGDRKLH